MEMCRACLQTENAMIPFNETSVSCYNLLTNLNVTLFDCFPHYFCNKCAQLLISFTDFKEKSLISETTLHEMIQHVKPEEKYLQSESKLAFQQEVKIEVLKNECNEEEDCTVMYDEPTNCCEEDEKKPEIDSKLDKKKQKSSKKCQKRTKNTKVKTNIKEKKPKKKVIDEAEIAWACGMCNKNFIVENELRSHLETHKNNKQCQICYESFNNWPALFGHRLDHIPVKQGKCHICNKRSKSSIYMEYHYLSAHNDGQEVVLTCKVCKKNYGTPTKLRNHMMFLHSEVKYICDYCSKGFTIKDTLKVHILTHSEHKPLVCDMCGFRCKLQTNLKAHKIRKHTLTKVKCARCQIVFVDQEKHDKHTCRLHEVMCPECGKILKHSRQLRRHRETHRLVGSHKCARCPAAFKTREALRVHTHRHDGVRTKQCDVCQAKFYSSSVLIRHRRIHTGNKLQIATAQVRLSDGVRTKQCDECQAKFYSSSVLIRHRRIHTGEKPYVCTICGRGFICGGSLKVHMKVHGLFLITKKDKPAENITDLFKM